MRQFSASVSGLDRRKAITADTKIASMRHFCYYRNDMYFNTGFISAVDMQLAEAEPPNQDTLMRASVCMILLCLLLTGCSSLGLLSVETERNKYNDVIGSTNAEQALGNLVRVKFSENPTFFDVIEVDQTKMAQATLQGGSSNIGALATLGMLQSTLFVSDVPLVKYQPPSAAGYIQQITAPIKVGNIAKSINSNAFLTSTILLSVNRLTPDYSDYYYALDLLAALDSFGAVSFAPITDEFVRISVTRTGIVTKRAAQLTGDRSTDCYRYSNQARAVDALWSRFTRLLNQPAKEHVYLHGPEIVAPGATILMRTALGALREAEDHTITFHTRIEAERIRSENIQEGKGLRCFNSEYYYIDTRREEYLDIPGMWDKQGMLLSENSLSIETIRNESRALGRRRSIILIEMTAYRPEDAYVSYFRRGTWYSIRDSDTLSKRNFALLNNLVLSQAQTPTAPTTPTVISVGPR